MDPLPLILLAGLALAVTIVAIRDVRPSARRATSVSTRWAPLMTPVAFLLGMFALIFVQTLIWPHQPSRSELAIEVVVVVGLTIGLRLWRGRPRS